MMMFAHFGGEGGGTFGLDGLYGEIPTQATL